MSKQFDIILFGVTGFTGKLAAEYLFERNYGVQWAVSARNATKADGVLKDLATKFGVEAPPILQADLVCETSEQEETLRAVVQQTKVVLTCSGPFEKYGQTLVKLCAELGVHYADITGETDFVRQNIKNHDRKAQETGAVLLFHCGNDCIPCDLTVYEMNKFAVEKGFELKEVMTYEEFSESASLSGGTAKTAAFQLGKDRTKGKTSFDPLLSNPDGEKSEYVTKNNTPKADVEVPNMPGRNAGPWIMGPVMVNCVRRSNALLGYSKELKYGDVSFRQESMAGWIKATGSAALLGAAVAVPSLFQQFLPQPGEGPAREDMEAGYLKLHAFGTMSDADNKESQLMAKFQFNKDTGYLYTAALLVETGMLLVAKCGSLIGGCQTPASALGSDLMERILKEMDTSFEVKVIEE